MDARRVSTLEADGILDLGVDRFDERRILSWAAANVQGFITKLKISYNSEIDSCVLNFPIVFSDKCV